ncbi:MAG: SpoIID/LytB domain-containing protein [Chlamydiae bacterium]|nr:SpoIID/LytB domain-containing protein [Chlamydiota bacterium]MBI3276822.1 SpoIID/LytB domain-containing protein [Chlamydiota bacterium]
MMKKGWVLSASFLLLFFSLGMSKRPREIERDIRVLIHQGIADLSISGEKLDVEDDEGRHLFQSLGLVHLTRKAEGIDVNGQVLKQKVIVLTSETEILKVQGKDYRGKILGVLDEKRGFLVINQLPLESYLRGVVGSEMPRGAPLESLMAQAIAARTFAYAHQLKNAKQPFDLDRPSSSQAYQGIKGESALTDQAIQETMGTVLVYRGKIFTSFFHHCCGGYTVKAKEVWPDISEKIPPARSCKPCQEKPGVEWKFKITCSEFRQILLSHHFPIPETFSAILHRDLETKRIESIEVANQSIPARELRKYLGHTRLKSTIFWLKISEDQMEFSGKGWGHGVGLCQYGAIALAEKGSSFQEILGYYYPKAKCVRLR